MVRTPSTRASRLKADDRVVAVVESWMQDETTRYTPVQGPAHVSLPSQNTLTAIRIMAAAEENHVPVVGYFCNTREQRRSGAEDLLRMIQSLIAQPIRFVPKRFATYMDFSESRLRACSRLVHHLPRHCKSVETYPRSYPIPSSKSSTRYKCSSSGPTQNTQDDCGRPFKPCVTDQI